MSTAAAQPPAADPHKLPSHFRDPAQMQWADTRFPGIRIKLLYEDKQSGLFTALFEWAPGAELPFHEHVELEQTFVLSGAFEDDEVKVYPGQYVARPPGSRHVARTKEGVTFLAFFLKPNIFFNQSGEVERFDPSRPKVKP